MQLVVANNEQFLVTPQTSPEITKQAAAAGPDPDQGLRDLEMMRARHHFVPSLAAILGYFVAAIVILLVLNWSNIFAELNSSTGSDPKTLIESFKYYSDNPIVSWATIILFWGSVGLAVYTFFWLGSAFITAARNEMIVETAFSRRGHFWDKVRVPLIKLVLLAAIVIIFILSMRFGVPAWGGLGANGVFVFTASPLSALGYIAMALVGTMINLYVLVTAIIFFRHADGIF